jgi:hypothetical protein
MEIYDDLIKLRDNSEIISRMIITGDVQNALFCLGCLHQYCAEKANLYKKEENERTEK